jgi:hypothetical protein
MNTLTTRTIPSINPLTPRATGDSQGRPCRPIWGGPVALALWAFGASALQLLPQPHPPSISWTSSQLLPRMQRRYTMLFFIFPLPFKPGAVVRIRGHNHCTLILSEKSLRCLCVDAVFIVSNSSVSCTLGSPSTNCRPLVRSSKVRFSWRREYGISNHCQESRWIQMGSNLHCGNFLDQPEPM